MKKRIAALLSVLLCVCTLLQAESFVNITPLPRQMTVNEGTFVLPRKYTVAVGTLPDTLASEAVRLLTCLNKTTGTKGKLTTRKSGTITLLQDASLGYEAYQLSITPKRIVVKASSSAGFFYACQSLKKMMPANVMAEQAGAAGTRYEVTCVEIDDAPRFWYRGFMLDCGRHFFTVDEIKHIMDGMAVYKMNYFHWHLSEDQGWRFEVKKYPRLTEVGSVAPDCRWNDMEHGTFWLGKQYGPYFYTQDECREVVEYARNLHIQVIPEIDMPGHIMSAMASYPEFSCTPDGEHKVTTHQGGIWSDVLNVGNPKAVQFAKDILTEVMDVFPCQYVHIGGDECPVSAWEKNDECRQLLRQLLADGTISPKTQGEEATTEQFSFNMQENNDDDNDNDDSGQARADIKLNFRPLQSYFISQINEHLKARGRKMMLWNESVTAKGADLDMIQKTRATIFCWAPAQKGALMSAQLGLNCIITEWGPGCYYINRKQWDGKDEPHAAGYGGKGDQLPGVYNYVPVPENVSPELQRYYIGVQATFWTEWVCDINYVNYLAYPRLLAVAEAGWSPQSHKQWEPFLRRVKADVPFFELTGRRYGKHYIEEK